ncbi:unnamed protein product [Mortierella alpina]
MSAMIPSLGGIPLKYISLVVLAVQNSCLIIVMALAQGPGRKVFYSSTAVFINEIVKLIAAPDSPFTRPSRTLGASTLKTS